MRRSFWIVWVDPKSNAKYPYKRHAEERHNEEKSVWRWGKRLVGCGHSQECQQSLDAGRGVDWTLPYALVGGTVLTVDLRPSSTVTEWISISASQQVCLYVTYLLCNICYIFVTVALETDTFPLKPSVLMPWSLSRLSPSSLENNRFSAGWASQMYFYEDYEKPSQIQGSCVI